MNDSLIWDIAQNHVNVCNGLNDFVDSLSIAFSSYSDDELKEVLQRNDSNGCYTDELRLSNFGERCFLSREMLIMHFGFASLITESQNEWNWFHLN